MKLALTLLCSALGPPHSAHADLTVTVYPGYSFTGGETPTTSKLNRLGRPTVYVSGTLSGTNALGADSVTGTHLNPSVAGSNITFDAASALVIANDGVGALQITNYMAGPGLSGGGGSIFTVLVDSNSIINLGDVIAVGTSLSNANLSATAAIQPSKLAFTSNTVFGATEYGTNGFLTLSGVTISGTTLQATPYHASVNFDPTVSGATVVASNNVSSVTRSALGVYVVNFTTAKANTNYLVFIGSGDGPAAGSILSYESKQTTNITINIYRNNGDPTDDPEDVSVMVW